MYTQAVSFAVLYAIWILPNTILVRNVCLVLGAIIGIYQIYSFRKEFRFSQCLSIILLLALFGWMTVHLLFLSNNFSMQYEEYRSVWKRSFLAFTFALGFGITLANTTPSNRRRSWAIFYLGLLAPTLIYIFRYLVVLYGQIEHIEISQYWNLYPVWSDSPYYVAKTAYVGFCAPTLCIALGQLYRQVMNGKWLNWESLIYFLTIPAVLFVFYAQSITNGLLYSLLFTLIFLFLIVVKKFWNAPIKITVFMIIALCAVSFIVAQYIQKNDSLNSLYADTKIALQVDRYEHWKNYDDRGYPFNEFGQPVAVSYYSRLAWGINAAKLVPVYPLGFGLIERSFGQIGKLRWPGSNLDQSHSGWLDLTLGIGIPGIILVLGSLISSLIGLAKTKFQIDEFLGPWLSMSSWALLSFLLIWCTTEISQKVFFEELIFFLVFSGTLVGVLPKSVEYKS